MSLTKIAVLSNVNMNFVIRLLKKEYEVYESEGYGNELGVLMNPQSSYHGFGPQVTFLLMDLMEVVEHQLVVADGATVAIDRWFTMLESCLKPEGIYYVSDAYLWGPEIPVLSDPGRKQALEAVWQKRLQDLCSHHTNVYILPYRHMVEQMGEENAFSLKTWYLGKILHTNEAQKRLSALICEKVEVQGRTAKKVLLLDLDNTLWGGLAGEADHTPIVLSEDHSGLAYKNLQRVILQMQKQGVILGIVSKNNEEDAMEILRSHPHQVLRPECFAVYRINWQPKHENIVDIAQELNLGLDSFVFWDDNPTERELVSSMLPQVTVPDFPDKPEELAPAMAKIYRKFFEKAAVTKEDLDKTKQYADNARRNQLQARVENFEEYLKQLAIVVTKEDPAANIVRLVQLVNKTNQFNLTTKRFDQAQMQEVLEDQHRKVFLYRVEDCFGDNGIVAAGIVECKEKRGDAGKEAVKEAFIEELVMSCRVMGKNIEYAIVEDMENALQAEGCQLVKACFLPTAKNKPVETLYEKLGYTVIEKRRDGSKIYEIDLAKRPERVYYVTMR
ncbi:MAG: HAD-IIIC family phosphatase [Lachnospiraceae bacterium]|nr:HAD-IIIC family phosphatase [Lachnospiraceae bacterium]